MKERNLINTILLSLPENVRMFRNNSGVAEYPDGSKVRYGIANPGGSDLIGWTTIEIMPGMVGQKIAVFTAIELKTGKVPLTKEQKNFLEQVKKAGGFAEVVRQKII